jgi:hypothetical protein
VFLRRDVGCPAAKEVGMGNPAEKTTGHPTIAILHVSNSKCKNFLEFLVVGAWRLFQALE